MKEIIVTLLVGACAIACCWILKPYRYQFTGSGSVFDRKTGIIYGEERCGLVIYDFVNGRKAARSKFTWDDVK